MATLAPALQGADGNSWRRRPRDWPRATGHGAPDRPELIPAAVNDYISGYLAALGTIVALIRRAREGGSYSVKVSLCRTAMWIEALDKLGEVVTAEKSERAGVIRLGGI